MTADDRRIGMTDADRFEAFVREYQQMVYATAVRLLGRAAEAEDVAQTVFLKAFQQFGELEGRPTVPGWLKTVTTNLCLNHLSRYRRRWQFFSEVDAGDGGETPFEGRLAQPAADAADADDEAARHARVHAALAALPDHQRVPLVLFHFESQSYEQIAQVLGVSLAKVKTDIFRGREVLRRVLGGA